MEITLTAKRDGVLFIDEEGNERNVYEGYEVLINDAESVDITEEDGQLVADIYYVKAEDDVMIPEEMYPLSDWDVFIR